MTPRSRDAGPRRILYLHTTSEVGGADVSLVRLIEGLDRTRFHAIVVLPSDGPLVGRLKDAGSDAVILPQMKQLTRRRGAIHLVRFAATYPLAAGRLAGLARSRRVDLVHTNTIHNLYGVAVARLARRPHVWHVREIVWQSGLLRRLETWLARFADRVVVTSDAVGRMFADTRGRLPANLRKVPNGVDIGAFAPGPASGRLRRDLDLPPDAPLVGVICRLDAWKGVDVFLRAAAATRASVPDARFVVVGGALPGQEEHARELERLAVTIGLGDRVRFAGWRYGPDHMPDVIRELRVLVLPSREPEPFGLVLLEAMACGVPTVATDHGGPREICVEGETGLLVPPGEPVAMAGAITELLQDPGRASRMGQQGRRRVESLFDQRQTVRAIERLYRELLEP